MMHFEFLSQMYHCSLLQQGDEQIGGEDQLFSETKVSMVKTWQRQRQLSVGNLDMSSILSL